MAASDSVFSPGSRRVGGLPGGEGVDRQRLLDALRRIESIKDGPGYEPVAIIGLGCRMPGGVEDPAGFWDLLRDGVDATTEFPADRAEVSGWYDEDPEAPGKAYVLRGGFLDEVDRFEPAIFGISPREAAGMDPQQRLVLQVVWEALERAGYAPDRLEGSKTGVFVGVSTTDYVRARQEVGDIRDVDAYQLIGEPSFIAGRVSYTFGLMGPSKVVDTTCSSSLVALHDACQSLRLRESDLALAGGVNLMLTPYSFVLLSKFRALSPDGRCKTFDASANGYGRGEGAGIVVLKRLSDAVAANDNIIAVVRGTAVNHDGRSSGISVPNPQAQQAVVRVALAQSTLDPADIGYVEAHGTGTALGDPIELRSLQAVLGKHHSGAPLLVGSVKTNIGHLEPAAGVAGLLKLVLSLQHKEIPPSLHFVEPNPNVDWDALDVEVVTRRRPWPDRGQVRAGAVSSFGASGTNAHAIVSEPPARTPVRGESRDWNALTLSARSETALRALAIRYAEALRTQPDLELGDVAMTTHVGRSRLPHGLAVAGDSTAEVARKLTVYADGRREDGLSAVTRAAQRQRKVGWLFTGQGSQYPAMAARLRTEPGFATALDEVAAVLDPLLDRPLRDLLADDGDVLNQTGYTQPALFAVEYAMARLWLSWGVRPAAVMGHSVGEIVAATIAGVLDLADACRLTVARGRLMQAITEPGVMATLVCDENRARAAIADRTGTVSIAAVNGPADTVISGAADDVAIVTARMEQEGVKHRLLNVSHAFHSPLMTPMLADLRAVAATIDHHPPKIPLVSNVTGALVRPDEIDADYWVRHAAGTVRFLDGIRTLYDDSFRTFLELGPQPVLSGLGARALDDTACLFVPTLRRGRDDRESVMTAVGSLYLRGVTVDWTAFHDGLGTRRVPLPTYAWEGESYWFPPARDTGQAIPTGVPVPGIGERLRTAQPTYQLAMHDARWEREAHDVDGRAQVGIGSLVDAAVLAAVDSLGGAWAAAGDVSVTEPLPLGTDRTVQVTLAGDAGDPTARFEVRSASLAEESSAAPWRRHAHGALRRRPGHVEPLPLNEDGTTGTELDWKSANLTRALADVMVRADRGTAGLRIELLGDQGRAELLDAAVAALSWAAGCAEPGTAQGFGDVVSGEPGKVRYLHALEPSTVDGAISGRVDFYAADGAWLGRVADLRVTSDRPAAAPEPWRDPAELLYRMDWVPAVGCADLGVPLMPIPDTDFLLLADRGGVAERLAVELTRRDAVVVLREPPTTALDDNTDLYRAELAAMLDEWRGLRIPGRSARVVVLTGLDGPDPANTDAATLVAYRDRAELLAVGVVQALLADPADADVRVTLVSRGGVATPGQQRHTPVATTLWGLGRVVALEHPRHWGGAIDLDPDADQDDLDLLVTALAEVDAEDQQALRDGTRLAARVVADAPEPEQLRREVAVRPDATYLITGAFGGIGQEVARWLALRGAGKLVLLGRTALPARDTWDAPALSGPVRDRIQLVRELEDTGTAVEVVSADVAGAAAVRRLVHRLAAGELPLRGVVHAAGVSGPQFVREVERVEYDKVWRPKVLGGWALHESTKDVALDFFLGFSSIAATWGSQHLTSYAAGNAFLDGLAHHRRSLGLPALTVAWSSWELESALFDEEIAEFLKATGLRPLSAPQSLRLLGAMLDQPEPYRIVCAADWSIYKAILEARAQRPVFRDIEIIAPAAGDSGTSAVRAELDVAAPEERLARLDRYVREQLAQLLRLDVAELAGEFHLLDMGLDSLMVMELISRSRKDLGVEIRSPDFFATDANFWAEFLFRRVEEQLDDTANSKAGEVNELAR